MHSRTHLLAPTLLDELDVEKRCTWIVHDPSVMSEFKPVEGVEVLTGGRPAGGAAPVPVRMPGREVWRAAL